MSTLLGCLGVGTPTTVECFGYTWLTNSQPLPPNVAAPPSPDLPAYNANMWQPQNVAVVDGGLQLTVQRNSGYIWNSNTNSLQPSNGPDQIWAGAQAVLDLAAMGQQLTYGTFAVTVQPAGGWGPFVGGDTAPGQETATTFGAFTYDPCASAPYGEMDVVEIGYQNQNQAGAWINQQPGGPSDSDAQFAVQPWDSGSPGQPNWSYVNRIALGPGNSAVTFLMDWQEGQPLSYSVVYGADPAAAITWTTPASTPIPAPTSTMSFFLNLWPYGGPSLGQPVTFNVLGVRVPLTDAS
jgi:hypothetical protein